MKKMNNKGFSLVELIVVVAIMAVLIGVLSPQYLRYVEKSRVQKDNSAIAEVVQSIKTAMADETINDDTASGKSFTITSGNITFASTSTASSLLEYELYQVVGTQVKLTSNTYKDKNVVFVVNKDGANYSVEVQGYIESVNASATTKKF